MYISESFLMSVEFKRALGDLMEALVGEELDEPGSIQEIYEISINKIVTDDTVSTEEMIDRLNICENLFDTFTEHIQELLLTETSREGLMSRIDDRQSQIDVLSGPSKGKIRDIPRMGTKFVDTMDLVMAKVNDISKRAKEIHGDWKHIKGTAALVSSIAVIGIIALVTRKLYRKHVHGECQKYSGKDLYICKIQRSKEIEEALLSQMSKCDKTDKPKLCKRKIEDTMKKIRKDRDKWEKKLL